MMKLKTIFKYPLMQKGCVCVRERERKTETESGMEGGRVSMRKEINNKRVIFKELHILTERFYSFM